MNNDVFNLGVSQYEHTFGLDEMDRDSDGFIILKPTAKRVDEQKSALTTNISDLEAKLKKFKAEKSKIDRIQKSDEYKESKKRMSKKKAKKKRNSLLEMVFNNADGANSDAETDEDEDSDESDGTYRDSRKTRAKSNKKTETTLDTTYGKRFSPVVSMLHDTIVEFDNIAATIEYELNSTHGQSKSMYRSAQIGNLISAKNSKLSAVKELAAVAKTVSDLEYKKEKDKKATEGADTSKALSMLGAKYLRGSDMFDDKKSSKKKKGDKKSDSKSKRRNDDDDDEDEEDITVKKQREDDQRALAVEFAKTLSYKKGDIKLTPHERFAYMEGKYTIIVVCEPDDPDNTYKFIAVDKNGREIKDFKDDYPGLLPRRKNCRMRFDLSRNKVTDLNSSRTYKLIYKD